MSGEILKERLYMARRMRGLSQEQLSERAGVPQSQISRLEAGKIDDPSFFTISRLAEALEIDLRLFSEMPQEERFRQLPVAETLTVADPDRPTDGRIPLGKINPGTPQEQVVAIGRDELAFNMGVIGRTGSGKSVLLQRMLVGLAQAGGPLALVDPHGSLADDALSAIIRHCPERADDIVYVDFGDVQHPVSFNPLDISTREQLAPAVEALIEMLDARMRLNASGAPRAVAMGRLAFTALAEANLVLGANRCTPLDLIPFFTQPEFRRLIAEYTETDAVRQLFDVDRGTFEKLSEKGQSDVAQPLIRAMSSFISTEGQTLALNSSHNKLDFAQLIAENKLVLIKLARFSHRATLGEQLGALLLPTIMSAATSVHDQRPGLRVIVDEAPSAIGAFSSIPELISQGRKWDLGLIWACQSTAQFGDDLEQQLLEASGSRVAMAADPASSTTSAQALVGDRDPGLASSIAELPNFHAYMTLKLPTDAASTYSSPPFAARCLPPLEAKLTGEQKRLREQVIASSRQLLSAPAVDHTKRHREILSELHVLLTERYEDGQAPMAPLDPEGWF